MGQAAVTDMPETVDKLALDSKQELTVDPRTVGLGSVDEMEIKYVVQKESYLTQFNWDVADSADTILWNARVHPALCQLGVGASSGTQFVTHTPMSHISQLFKYWTGDIVFRFTVVCSDYHKGRIRITADPNYLNLTGGQQFNNVYSRVIDISKERDFEIRVTWMQRTAWRNVDSALTSTEFGVTPFATSSTHANGVLSVQVLNELTTPNSAVAHDAHLLVFVRAADNLTFSNPVGDADALQNSSVFADPTALALQSAPGAVMDCENNPNPEQGEELTTDEVGDGEVPQDMTVVYAGEEVTSLRQLLRRYWTHGGESANTGASGVRRKVSWLRDNFPEFRGYSGPNSYHSTSTLIAYNYFRVTLLNYLAPAYVAYRGGIRYKYLFDCPTNSSVGEVSRNHNVTGSRVTDLLLLSSTNPDASAAAGANNLPQCGSGAAITAVSGNPTLEVELPFYSKYRFALSRNFDNNRRLDDDSNRMGHIVSAVCANNSWASHQRYSSVGEDFSFFMYLNAPTFYLYSNPTSA
jgi:hypothetical protein